MTHKISITVSDEMKKRLDDYRFGNRIDKFQTAVLDILKAGLQFVENDGMAISEESNEASIQDDNILSGEE